MLRTVVPYKLTALAILPALFLGCFLSSSPAIAQDLADIIEQAEKSVVRIEVAGNEGESLGSGFIIDNAGTMITNCHVLAGATSATVHFPNGTRGIVRGTLLIDPDRDIAVAKISVSSAPAISLNTDLPRKGETVTALGSPVGLSFTATTGIVSAIRPAAEMARDLGRSNIKGTWVQVDAAISPGNSGGPLINRNGEVVAMCTLASQGVAQNLNFGISAKDIQDSIGKASNASLQSLRDGIAKVRMESSSGGGGGGPGSGGGSGVGAKSIPSSAIAAYIEEGQASYSELVRGLRMESARLSADLKGMRKGTPRLPPSVQSRDTSAVKVAVPGQRDPKWFFSSQSVKDEAVRVQQQRIKNYTRLKTALRSNEDAGSMFELLWNYGPPLDVRKNKSVGFITDLFVIRAFNEHEALASYDGKPYLLWLDSTAGISGGEILSGPTFVAGTVSIMTRDGLPTAVTVLQEVTEDQLRTAVEAKIAPATGFRTWQDSSGNYKVEAKLLGQDTQKVVLQKKDGSIVNVPKSKLSTGDQTYLKSLQP
ncbi:MAG: trypsin-like peptidase domain-containing protein [Planctomycetota bacterium]